MGMFDSFYDAKGNEWQTKAFDCVLDTFGIGGSVPSAPSVDHQVMVLGETFVGTYVDTFATIRDGRLTDVPTERDETLPLLDYSGGWLTAPWEIK